METRAETRLTAIFPVVLGFVVLMVDLRPLTDFLVVVARTTVDLRGAGAF